jgi:transcription initiation factor TFIIH subunit 3
MMTTTTNKIKVNNGSTKSSSSSNTLLVIVLDVSPLSWGEHDLKRKAQDKSRMAAGKRSVGPAILEEMIDSILILMNTIVCCLERNAAVLLIGVADNEIATLYPRKDQLAQWLNNSGGTTSSESTSTCIPDTRFMKEDIITGVAELMLRASNKASFITDPSARYGGMAAGFSMALCLINRFLVTAQAGGVSALRTEHYLERVDDEGVVALMGKSNSSRSSDKNNSKKPSGQSPPRVSTWDPRILLIQTSDDRARDYNAFMNCSFAAAKHHIVVDGCFLSSSSSGNSNKSSTHATSSAFLEQAVDITGGIFLAPYGAAQVGGTLTEVLLSVFLPSTYSCRSNLNLPALNKVDFRARCFETGTIVDMAYVCNQCLSIFRNKPTAIECPTCQATIIDTKKRSKKDS